MTGQMMQEAIEERKDPRKPAADCRMAFSRLADDEEMGASLHISGPWR